jgi:hypothetical protein
MATFTTPIECAFIPAWDAPLVWLLVALGALLTVLAMAYL